MANRAWQLLEHAAERPEATALIFEDAQTSYRQLAEKAWSAAGQLASGGVRRGDHVGLWLPSTPDFIIAEQALFLLGAVVTPINILYRPGEVKYAVDCCDLRWLVTNDTLAADVASDPPCPLIGFDSSAIAGGGSAPMSEVADVAADDLAMLLLTSATTGKAKGVMLSASNLAANYDRTPEWLGLTQDSVILCALPLYNTFGLNQGINAMLVTGCSMVLLARFDAERCIQAIARHRCTFLPAVPTMLQKIIDHPSASRETLGSLRTVMTGGAPVPSALLKRLLELAPDVRLLTGYGLTEGTALVTLTEVRLDSSGDIERGRTIGRVLDGMELAILDDDGHRQPAGDSGEIAIRGPNVMAGYYRSPEDTAAALSDGWLRTGDIGYLDAEGYAFIVDRKKDVIIRGGQNIYPADIEEALYSAPGVAEVAVVAREDEMLGEVPVAFVALRSGSASDADSLLQHCRTSLATYKCPVAIEILDELPKGPTGKILRRALKPQTASA
jgi:long-chain acyl-CoA synthetase